MKYWLRVLRAYLGFESVPKCHVCHRYCVKGWFPEPNPLGQDARYICCECYAKEPIA